MKKLPKNPLIQLAFAIVICAGSCISAQAQNAGTDDAVFQGLGAKAGIDKIVSDFIPIVLVDQRIGRFFEKANTKHLASQLSDQFCELTGGPCKYTGKDMYEVHEGMEISNAHFNALAEDLQIAMEKNNIPSSISNKLIARLAPMQRPIVSK